MAYEKLCELDDAALKMNEINEDLLEQMAVVNKGLLHYCLQALDYQLLGNLLSYLDKVLNDMLKNVLRLVLTKHTICDITKKYIFKFGI